MWHRVECVIYLNTHVAIKPMNINNVGSDGVYVVDEAAGVSIHACGDAGDIGVDNTLLRLLGLR